MYRENWETVRLRTGSPGRSSRSEGSSLTRDVGVRLRGCAASARQPSPASPSRSSRFEGSSLKRDGGGPPPRLRRFGATAFAWLAEPKLTVRGKLVKAGRGRSASAAAPLRRDSLRLACRAEAHGSREAR